MWFFSASDVQVSLTFLLKKKKKSNFLNSSTVHNSYFLKTKTFLFSVPESETSQAKRILGMKSQLISFCYICTFYVLRHTVI